MRMGIQVDLLGSCFTVTKLKFAFEYFEVTMLYLLMGNIYFYCLQILSDKSFATWEDILHFFCYQDTRNAVTIQ